MFQSEQNFPDVGRGKGGIQDNKNHVLRCVTFYEIFVYILQYRLMCFHWIMGHYNFTKKMDL